MNRIFIVYYDFSITSGNHAGMTHLVKLVSKQVQEVRPIKSISHNFRGGTLVAVIYACCLAVYFRFILKRGDKVIFFEYLTKGIAHQSLTAYLMRKLGITSPILALIHLSGDHLLELYGSKEKLIEKLKPIDKAVVFGSSLAKFIKSIGFEKEIVTTFHYADTDFYKPAANSKSQCELNVICMGGLKRNFRSLRRIIEAVPEIKFHVLMGKSELKPIFGDLKNVALYSYMSENDMFRLMKGCDASLSVLEDTIGSNVITSSMATGLIQIVSDVGSIRDYCSNDDSFLCTKEEDFIYAIKTLSNDRNLLREKRKATIAKSYYFSPIFFIKHLKDSL